MHPTRATTNANDADIFDFDWEMLILFNTFRELVLGLKEIVSYSDLIEDFPNYSRRRLSGFVAEQLH